MGIKYHTTEAPTVHPNGSSSYCTAGAFTSVAKVGNCPCEDGVRRTAHATAEPDTFFSIPACVYVGQKTVSGFLASEEDGWKFVVIRTGKNANLIEEKP